MVVSPLIATQSPSMSSKADNWHGGYTSYRTLSLLAWTTQILSAIINFRQLKNRFQKGFNAKFYIWETNRTIELEFGFNCLLCAVSIECFHSVWLLLTLICVHVLSSLINNLKQTRHCCGEFLVVSPLLHAQCLAN